MRQLWSFEFQKIVGRKLIRVALLAYGVLILILLSNSRVAIWIFLIRMADICMEKKLWNTS